MPTSDEELAKLQKSVAAKRERLVAENAKREAQERNSTNEIVALQLKAEEARLDADLAILAQQAKAKDGAAAPLEAARDEMKRAVAAQEAAGASPSESNNKEKGN